MTASIDGFSRMRRYSVVAVTGCVWAATSLSRSSLISAMCSSLTQGLAAEATARMPPHQPVPMIPTLICLMCLLSSCRLTELLQHARDVAGRRPGAPVELLEKRLRNAVLGLPLAIERTGAFANGGDSAA